MRTSFIKARMKRIVSILFFFAGLSAHAKSGLYPIDHAQVPAAFKTTADAIFEIVIYSKEPQLAIEEFEYDVFLKRQEHLPTLLKLLQARVDNCKSAKLKVCLIYTQASGTTFLATDSQTLWTARHVLETFFKAEDNHYFETPLLFQLYDAGGNLIFDTMNEDESAKVSAIGDSKVFHHSLNAPPETDDPSEDFSDFARIRLSRELSQKPLNIRPRNPRLHEKVFVLGYPVATQGRTENFNSPDSDGVGLRVSIGRVIKATRGLVEMDEESSKRARKKANRAYRAAMIAGDFDGVPGQSGGPVVDVDGNVLGIFTIHSSVGEQQPDQAYSRGGGAGVHFDWIYQYLKEFPELAGK
jgi:hypothetical protein